MERFYNSSGDFAFETADALCEIGADRTAEIYKTALASLGEVVPKNRAERETMLDSVTNDEVDEILGNCDTDFYKYIDNLGELCYHYIIKNKSHFTR